MKIENITKLILKFIGGGIIKFPTRFLKWIIIEPCNCDGGGDGGGDSGGDGGDTPSSINLDDFRNFTIGLVDDYYNNAGYNVGDIIPITNFFDVSSMDIFKGLSVLGNNGNNGPEIIFHAENNYENESFYHNINITPYQDGFQINVATERSYIDEETSEQVTEYYSAQLIVNVDNETLEIYNIGEDGQ